MGWDPVQCKMMRMKALFSLTWTAYMHSLDVVKSVDFSQKIIHELLQDIP